MLDALLSTLPLWFCGLLLVAACLLSAQLGRLAKRRFFPGKDKASLKGAPDARAQIVGAIFGLLAFMISLTFSISVNRFEQRRSLVAEEANAIHKTYLRASLFDDPASSKLQSTLLDYARTRIAPNGLWDARMDLQLRQSHALQNRLWEEARAAAYPVRTTTLASSLIESVNETLDGGTRRELAGKDHIPTRIFEALLLYLVIAAGALGYLYGGAPADQRPAAALLFLLFTIAITLIVDLDRPRWGAIQVPEGAIRHLVDKLESDQRTHRPRTE